MQEPSFLPFSTYYLPRGNTSSVEYPTWKSWFWRSTFKVYVVKRLSFSNSVLEKVIKDVWKFCNNLLRNPDHTFYLIICGSYWFSFSYLWVSMYIVPFEREFQICNVFKPGGKSTLTEKLLCSVFYIFYLVVRCSNLLWCQVFYVLCLVVRWFNLQWCSVFYVFCLVVRWFNMMWCSSFYVFCLVVWWFNLQWCSVFDVLCLVVRWFNLQWCSVIYVFCLVVR